MKQNNTTRQFIRRFHAMGTEVELRLWQKEERQAENALRMTERFFHQTEARLSRFRANSELSQLNRSVGAPFPASQVLFSLVQSALEWREATSGIFDPTVLNALVHHGYDRSFDLLSAEQPDSAGDDLEEAVTWPLSIPQSRYSVTPTVAVETIGFGDRRQITLPVGVGIDLGGIAKGWTIQQAAYRLSKWGPCQVDAGGDIACIGEPPAGPWLVSVADPHTPEKDIAILSLTNQAVATSSRASRRWLYEGRSAHHLIDPRTGAPAITTVLSATVVGKRLPDVEIHAKTALILGENEGLAYLNQVPAISAILVIQDGRHLKSDTFEKETYVSSGNYADRFRTAA